MFVIFLLSLCFFFLVILMGFFLRILILREEIGKRGYRIIYSEVEGYSVFICIKWKIYDL